MVAFMKDFHERNVQYDQFQSKLRIAGKINTQDLSEVYCSEFVAEGLVRVYSYSHIYIAISLCYHNSTFSLF